MTSPIIYYIRHGQTDWNAELRFQGQRDIPLNDNGRDQARQNGQKLIEILGENYDVNFVSSPMGRARETMEIIRGQLGLAIDDYKLDPRLTEASYGDWEGTTLPEIKLQFPDEHKRRKRERWTFCPPNGESHEDILGRIVQWAAEIDHPTVVTAHGVVGRVLRQHILQMDQQEAADFPFPQNKICVLQNGTEQFL